MKNIELQYDKEMKKLYEKRTETINQNNNNNNLYSEFWLRVLCNHKIIKDFISEEDKKVLKHLRNITYDKFEDGNVKNNYI
jgi:hypothetical protein